jgi:hypothetical protein
MPVPIPSSATENGMGTEAEGSVSHATPHFCRIDRLVRIEGLRPFQQDIGPFRIQRIRNTTIIDRTDGRTLWFIKMADALSTPIMRDYVNIVPDALAVTHMKSLLFRAAASFKDRLVRAFW